MATIPDYLIFFNLKDHPFRLTPDTNYYFPSKSHQQALKIIEYGLLRGEGFLILTGEPGTGKTLLLRYLFAEKFPEKEIAYLLTPTLSPKELIMALLEDIGLEFSSSDSKEQLLRKFKNYLLNLASKGKNLVVVIDEAQNLPLKTLEELRLLSNLETEKRKLLQILLVGQPGLKKKLHQPSLSQLLQRITIWENLKGLTFEETVEYVRYRWYKAGGIGDILDKGAQKSLFHASRGIPRIINKIMDRAILFAAAGEKKIVDKKTMIDAINSLGINTKGGFNKRYFIIAAAIILLLLGIIFFKFANISWAF